MPRADEWSDDEIILALATCPRKRQSYSPRDKNVIDLADLIGRTPGAVSLHFANISHLIHGRPHGKTHVGARTRELFNEFKGRDTELQANAAEIRRRYLERDPTPRLEQQVPKERGHQLTLDVFQAARENDVPEESVHTYEREGSWYFGVLVQLPLILAQYRDQTSAFLRWLRERLGDGASRSKGFDLAVNGKWQELADDVISSELPMFHVEELKPEDRITLALRLDRGGTVKGWKPTKGRLRLLASMDREAERQRIAAYLKIDTAGICDMCLLMLIYLVNRTLGKKQAGQRPR